ncbi:protein disulfide isomerase, putative, partial [Rhizoctonia solani AG-3 Rhs1AP]
MNPGSKLDSTATSPAILPPQYTSSEWLKPPLMVNESETDAIGIPWLLSPEWAPGKPTGRGRRLTMPPKQALAEIHDIFSKLYHRFCDSLPLKFEGNEPLLDWAYVETRHYMMRLQALSDELNALKVSSEDENGKHGLAMAMQGAIFKVEGHVKQKRSLALNHEEHSKLYGRVRTEQRARRVQRTEPGCVIS